VTSPLLRDRLRHELAARGCSAEGHTPDGTIVLADAHFDDVLELLDIMLRRRERAFQSVDAVGRDSAQRCYDDAVIVIEAIKVVLAPLCDRTE
jgi:hypothetical protein